MREGIRTSAESPPFPEGVDDHLADAARSQGAKDHKGQRSGLVPEGDVRLTANIRCDLHLKLKIRAAQERTTIGELIEKWVTSWQ